METVKASVVYSLLNLIELRIDDIVGLIGCCKGTASLGPGRPTNARSGPKLYQQEIVNSKISLCFYIAHGDQVAFAVAHLHAP
jgi:hypothetical protein